MNLFAKIKIKKQLEAMCLSLVSVQLGHCIERPFTTRAEKLGVPMEGPPVISSMGGFAKVLGTTLTGARKEDRLGLVVDI